MLKPCGASKVDGSGEVHFPLGLNVRHAAPQLRGTISRPHGTGREQRVAVFAEGEKAKEAEEAGADVVRHPAKEFVFQEMGLDREGCQG